MTSRNLLQGCAVVAVLVALALAAWLLPLKEWFIAVLTWIHFFDVLDWISAHRKSAWLLYIGIYVVGAVIMFPAIILTTSAGLLFGPIYGSLIVSAGSTLGAAAAFVIGRTVGRDWIAHKIEAYPKFRALDRALAKRGFWIVALSRLTPIFPYNVANYAYGLSSLDFRRYIFGSWIGMAGPTVLYVYLGSMARSLTEISSGMGHVGAGHLWMLAVGAAATVILIVLVTRLATRALDEELAAC